MAQCATCKGQKTVILSREKSPLGVAVVVGCPECQGTGETGNPDACPSCNGSKTTVVSVDGLNIRVRCPDCSSRTII